MAAKSRPIKEEPSPGWLRPGTFVFLLLLLVAAFLGSLIWAGHWGLEQLRGRDRYDMPFTEIECIPPVGMDRQEFLHEVRYVDKRLPQQVHLLDEDLVQRLHEGFAKHPWVEKVDNVQIMPPKRIVLKLTYRKPVLIVKIGTKVHAVDNGGVLLPPNAPTEGLPIYDREARLPQGPAGTRWGDPDVEAAARKSKK